MGGHRATKARYSSTSTADQEAAQFRVYRQEFLELLFLTEEDEKVREGADGPIHEKAVGLGS
ncbi:hypothetical protein Pmar_PMAR009973 [Perkinsus marinus ATCC 50983]|uniref:Uncharacterized protein n=1 Tax=Perkinsus marinus (strain ATCC 50983 / TXsc) TaxID=423536 RepID=C5L2R6_PERM5|nr:hypothetical protein Pmar_PMAR009973 [Perkinsus marinus ATCC 50983]EER08981.1 hypothetical protein Pmar_PMAR009973 [Perkinsus marinus ATCC 50983]|eukprot:XP_002777165.1 hypothetical protein Pmar_PMAR009973 [Perkinsus marinus ATCC 50983]